ncbi:Aste57867_11398 [Aphanomyces stellatus]|uniref:Aste57867_11398 protein n=1 Tax=Aphanomyces stellatus TaxID=120398 RepID=A0A485KT75_9STRA|nr:hypothetical protein As57867_011356 [Aphanomyces stellatus]VFT88259.1 Aste57867_11398 [Aphanomyces stellatus]
MTFHIFHHDEDNLAHEGCVHMSRATPAKDIVDFGKESLRLLDMRESGHDSTEWHEAKHGDDVVVYRGIVDGSVWNCIKTVATIHCSAAYLCDRLNDAKAMTTFDEMSEYCHVIADIDAATGTSIRHVKAKAIFPTSARDFLVVTSAAYTDKVYTIATRSILHNDVPMDPHWVRATTLISGYVIRATGDHQCEVTMIAHMDLGGHFPAFVINLLAVDSPMGLMKRLQHLYNGKDFEPTKP